MSTTPGVESPRIQGTRWRIDPQRSSIEFHVRHLWGLQTVKGRFQRYEGTLDLAAQPAVELTIDADSLDTKNAKRDEHLRSADFFDTANHPQITFVSERATLDGDRLAVWGDLHAAGNSIPLELEGSLHGDGDELDIEVTTHVDHRTLGLLWNQLGMIRPPSKLIVRARLVAEGPAGADAIA